MFPLDGDTFLLIRRGMGAAAPTPHTARSGRRGLFRANAGHFAQDSV